MDEEMPLEWWMLAALVLVARGRVWRPNGYYTSRSSWSLDQPAEACRELRRALERCDEDHWTALPNPRGRVEITQLGMIVMRGALVADGREQVASRIATERLSWASPMH